MEKEGAESGVVSFQKGDPVAIASLEACPDPYFESFNYVGTVEAVMATGDVAVRFGEHQHTFKPGALVQVPRLFVGDFVKLVDDIRTNGWLKLDDCYKEKAQACGGICVVLNAGDTSHDGIRVTLGEDQHYISQLHLDFVARRLEADGKMTAGSDEARSAAPASEAPTSERRENQQCGFFYAESLEGDRFKLLQDSMQNLPDVYIGFSRTGPNVACGDMVKVSRDMTSFLPWLLRKNTLAFAYKRSLCKASDEVAAHPDLKKCWDTLLERGKVVEVNFDGNAIVEFTSGSAWCIRSTFLQLVKQTGIGSFGQTQNSSKYISSEECSQGTSSDDVLLKEVAYFLKNIRNVPNPWSLPELCKQCLFAACFGGSIENVDHVLGYTEGVNSADTAGNTPLHYAVHGNQPEMVKYLLKKGAGINATNRRHHTPLQFAVKEGFSNCVRALTKHDRRMDAQHDRRLDPNIQDDDGNTALHVAIATNNAEIINELIGLPQMDFAITNKSGLNVLHVAALTGNAEVAKKILLKQRGLVDVREESQGYAALHFATISGHSEVVNVLLKEKCVVDIANKREETALLLAAREQHWGIVELLVQHQADINKQDQQGNTALHMTLEKVNDRTAKPPDMPFSAAIQDVEDKIEDEYLCNVNGILLMAGFLAQKGARIRCRNKEGITPLDIASKMKFPALELLISLQGDIRDAERSTCKKCLRADVNTVFQPCGHWLYCNSCCLQMTRCPTCNVIIVTKYITDGGASMLTSEPRQDSSSFTAWSLVSPIMRWRSKGTRISGNNEATQATQPMLQDETYKLEKKPRGLCIIIHNHKFDNMKERWEGSDQDANHMKELFKDFHFIIKYEESLTTAEMKRLLSKAAIAQEQKDADCLVVIIISFGSNTDKNVIYGKDWEPLDLLSDVYSLFNNENCPALIDKPKLFFIQSLPSETPLQNGACAKDTVAADAAPQKIVPDWSDMYCIHTTLPKYMECGGIRKGTCFFADVDNVFRKHAANTDLEGLMRKVVMERNARKQSSHTTNYMPTLSIQTFGWMYQLYFNPNSELQ